MELMDQVRWSALGKFFEGLTLCNKVQESAVCPVCATEIETWEHMFQCKHDTTCTARLHMIGKLGIGLKKMKTNNMCGVETTPPHIPRDELGDLLSNAVVDQNELGWDNLIKGQISKTWGHAQAVHFKVFNAGSNSTQLHGGKRNLSRYFGTVFTMSGHLRMTLSTFPPMILT
eukprot:8309442-Ditylum_brightwellii.AAC.1